MGGGNEPSMDFLRGWMYEVYETNVDGVVVQQDVMHAEEDNEAADGKVVVPMEELVEFMSENAAEYITGHHLATGEFDFGFDTAVDELDAGSVLVGQGHDQSQRNLMHGGDVQLGCGLAQSMPTYLDHSPMNMGPVIGFGVGMNARWC